VTRLDSTTNSRGRGGALGELYDVLTGHRHCSVWAVSLKNALVVVEIGGKIRRALSNVDPLKNSILASDPKQLCRVSSNSIQNCDCRSDNRQRDRRQRFYNMSHAML